MIKLFQIRTISLFSGITGRNAFPKHTKCQDGGIRIPDCLILALCFLMVNLFIINKGNAQITQRGGTTNVTESYVLDAANTNLLSINKPTVSAGDIMIANISALTTASDNRGYGATCSGWIQISYQDFEQGAGQHTATILYRVVDGTEGSSFTFTIGVSSKSCHGAGSIIAFSGVNTTSPIDVAGTYKYSTNKTASVTTNAITTITDNDVVLVLVGAYDDVNSIGSYTGSPTLSKLYSYDEDGSNPAGTVGVGAAYSVSANTTTNNLAATLGVSEQWAAILIALKPACTSPTVSNTPLTQTICSGSRTTLVTLTSSILGTTFAWTGTATAGVTGFTTGGTGTIPVQLISTTGTTQGIVTYAITPTAAGCSGAVTNYTVLINTTPSITAMTAKACSGTAFAVTPVNGTNGVVPSLTTYSWGFPTGSGFSGGATGTVAVNISGTLTNTTSGVVTATYTVTPTSGSCAGSTFAITVTLPAVLNPGSINTTGGNYCSGGNVILDGTNSPYCGASGGMTPYSYQWMKSYQAASGCSGNWSTASGTNNGTSYNPPAFSSTGTYCLQRIVNDGCGTMAYSGIATFNVYPDLVSNNIIPSPNTSSVCAGTSVSATFSGGSGGAAGLYADRDSVSTNGGLTWIAYSGGVINTAGLSGNNIVQIKTRRVAISVAGCNWGNTNSYSWTIYPLPSLFTVIGGGSYCAGGSGVNIGLNGSESGVNYQLQFGGSAVGIAVAGTGGILSFGLQTVAGTYTVIAANATTGCQLRMTGNQNIVINQLPSTSPVHHR